MSSRKLPELLCPAGDESALRAAVDCGANAVYLGYKAFGARASAMNFDGEALERAVRYAHLYRTRVHVTVNTLVKPDELDEVDEALRVIAQAGADAVIVQDLGVARLVCEKYPSLSLHASTQMAISTVHGTNAVRALGFERVVLARECSLDTIRKVAQTGIETEVFIHGALCTAVSGRCLMSSMAGGRSGNRGRCAQPCRQLFSMNGVANGPLLSLRDLCLLDDLPALCEAGVASLKIEGRLKSAEYVAVVTEVYRRALDCIALGTFVPGDPALREALLQIFNRGGFTRGHAMDEQDAALVTPELVSHQGVPLGQVCSVKGGLANVHVNKPLHDGDSLRFGSLPEGDLRYSGADVRAGDVAVVRLRPGIRTLAGAVVSRLSDAKQLERARSHTPRPIPVSMLARFQAGEPMRLCISDGRVSVSVKGPIVQAALKRPSTVEEVCKQLEKLGGTPFELEQSAQVVIEGEVFLPVAALNALRRDSVDKLIMERVRSMQCVKKSSVTPSRHAMTQLAPAPLLSVIFSDLHLADDLRSAGAKRLIYSPHDMRVSSLTQALSQLPDDVWLRLPPQTPDDVIETLVPLAASGIGGIVAESVDQLGRFPHLKIWAGEGIPVTNAAGLHAVADMGVCGFSLWPEWTGAEQRALGASALPCVLKMYGRETLMLLNHCPERVRLGLSSGRASCALCTEAGMACGRHDACLTDRKGYRFPVLRTRFPQGCSLSVLNALPTDLRAYDSARRTLGAGVLLHFTTEEPHVQIALTKAFRALAEGDDIGSADFPTTAGHWLRGVE